MRANDDVSMVFESGHIYAVLGENGAGKSTLMKILSGYQPPDSGQLALDGGERTNSSVAHAGGHIACGESCGVALKELQVCHDSPFVRQSCRRVVAVSS